MFQRLYCIYDSKAEMVVRNVVFVSSTEGSARRMFQDIVAVKESEIGMHPEDYHLLYLGDLHLEECRIDGAVAPRATPVASALSVLKALEQSVSGRQLSDETVDMFGSHDGPSTSFDNPDGVYDPHNRLSK